MPVDKHSSDVSNFRQDECYQKFAGIFDDKFWPVRNFTKAGSFQGYSGYPVSRICKTQDFLDFLFPCEFTKI